jgi:hypothetical protein
MSQIWGGCFIITIKIMKNWIIIIIIIADGFYVVAVLLH